MTPPTSQILASLHGLRKRDGATATRAGIGLKVRKREVLGVSGGNGANKRTPMDVLPSAVQADCGGVDVAGESRRERVDAAVGLRGDGRAAVPDRTRLASGANGAGHGGPLSGAAASVQIVAVPAATLPFGGLALRRRQRPA